VVDGSDDIYLRVVCDYVHLNPVRAGLVATEGKLADYACGSFPEYLKLLHTRRFFVRLRCADREASSHAGLRVRRR